MEDILSTYYKCPLSAITHKLNVSGHMSIWTVFLILLCGTRARSLSAPFSYTLYVYIYIYIYIFQLHPVYISLM
jgi:hypothetical protein